MLKRRQPFDRPSSRPTVELGGDRKARRLTSERTSQLRRNSHLRDQRPSRLRLELDAWVDDYISRNGRPGLSKGDRIWDAKSARSRRTIWASSSISASASGAFARALKQLPIRGRTVPRKAYRAGPQDASLRRSRSFEVAAAKSVRERNRTLLNDIAQPKRLMPWIGSLPLNRVHTD